LEQATRERAYHLWIADGCRDGNADDHWLNAQRELLAASLGTFVRVTVDDPKAMMETKPRSKGKTTSKIKGKRRAA
jgi:Protein of unknown function (DUF2934)